jgi:putative cell wall-binding protein
MQRRVPFVVLLVGLLVGALVPPAFAATPAVADVFMVGNQAGSGGWFGQTEITRSPGVTNLALHVDAQQEAVVPIRFPFGGDDARLNLHQAIPIDLDAPFSLRFTGDGADDVAVAFPAGFWFRPVGDDGVFEGGAPPGESVTVTYGFSGPSVTTVVPASGRFTVDLADDGFVGPIDADGRARLDLEITGATMLHFIQDWELPRFDIRTSGGDRTQANIHGWALTAGVPVTVNGVVQAGYYETDAMFTPMDISNGTPGNLSDDVLEVSTQGRSYTIPVPAIAVTDVNLTTDVASGVGPPNATVIVGAFTDGGNDASNPVATDASGAWSFDFSGSAPATAYARVRAAIPFADRPPGLGNDLYDEVEVGTNPSASVFIRPDLYLAPGASAPEHATFAFNLPGSAGDPVELTWTPNDGSGGTIEIPLEVPPGWSAGRVLVTGDQFGGSWDPTAGGALDASIGGTTYEFVLAPAKVVASGRNLVVETDPGQTAYLSLEVLSQEFDGPNATANAAGVATFADALPFAGALHAGTVSVVSADGYNSATRASVAGGETVVPVGDDGATVFVPAGWIPPGSVTVGPGASTGLELVATSHGIPHPPGWDPAAAPIIQYDPPWSDPVAIPVTLRDAAGPVRVPAGRTVEVAVPLGRTPQPDEDVYLGIWTAEHGWETVPPADVTVCLDTSLPGCDGSPGMHVAATVPHASTYAAFIGNPAGADLDLARASGPDRIATAIELSKTAFPDGADIALVARADDFADALAAVPLAAAAGAPVLLNTRDGLDSRVAAEINRLGATTVLLMGGEAAQSASAATGVGALSGVTTVERRAGLDRFETAGKIAADAVARWQAGGDTDAGDHVIVALGAHPTPSRAWPDALSSGQLAAAAHAPILLVASGGVPPPTSAAIADLGASRASVIGGTAAISNEVAGALGIPTTRYGGADRFATSLVVAEAAYAAGATDRDVLVATGLNFPDGLAAGAATAARVVCDHDAVVPRS